MLEEDLERGVDVFATDTKRVDAKPLTPIELPPPDWSGEDRRAVEPPATASATPNLDRVRAELQEQEVDEAIDLEVVEHDSDLLDAGDVETVYEGDRTRTVEL